VASSYFDTQENVSSILTLH